MASKPKKRPMGHRTTLEKIPPTNDSDFSPESYFDGIKDLPLDKLANEYTSINTQFQMMKGLILLAAREHFPSNKEFGDWVNSVHALCVDGQQVRNRYMHLADFFKTRPMTGISLTAAYEISKPDNASIAEQIYEKAVNNDLRVSDVKKLIQDMKTSENHSLPSRKKQPIDDTKLSQVFALVNGFNMTQDASIALLHACIAKFKNRPDDVIEGEVTKPRTTTKSTGLSQQHKH